MPPKLCPFSCFFLAPLQARAFSFAKGGMVAAARTHRRLLAAVLHLPAAFFDATPAGRVLNRFSSDTGGCLLRGRSRPQRPWGSSSPTPIVKIFPSKNSDTCGCLPAGTAT